MKPLRKLNGQLMPLLSGDIRFRTFFLLSLPSTGLDDDEIGDLAGKILSEKFFQPLAACDTVLQRLVMNDYYSIVFPDRHSIDLLQAERSSHQCMHEMKNAATNFRNHIATSWIDNIASSFSGVTWIKNSSGHERRKLERDLERSGNNLVENRAIILAWLDHQIAAIVQALPDSVGSEKNELTTHLKKSGQAKLIELQRVRHTLEKFLKIGCQGAFVKPIFPEMRIGDWLTYDLTDGEEPTAIMTAFMGFNGPLY